MGLPSYATVEQVATAADIKATAYETTRLTRLVASASRQIERTLNRHFYPLTETRNYYLDSGGEGFWLEADLLSLTSATADGDSVSVGDVTLESFDGNAPYNWAGVSGVDIALTGVWGYTNDTDPAGALAANISSTSATTAVCDDSSVVGIGDAIKVNSEWMVVTAKAMRDTTVDLAADLTAQANDVTVTVDDGSALNVGETLLVDSERMLIVDIASNDLTVIRAWDGTVLATHDGTGTPASVYAPRTLTVLRGQLGSTAATHTSGDAITRNLPPSPITDLCIAEALNTYAQETSAYGRTVGSGEGQREARGAGLADARRRARSYRRTRLAAV